VGEGETHGRRWGDRRCPRRRSRQPIPYECVGDRGARVEMAGNGWRSETGVGAQAAGRVPLRRGNPPYQVKPDPPRSWDINVVACSGKE